MSEIVFEYHGGVYFRPIGRGIAFNEDFTYRGEVRNKDELQLEDLFDGDYEMDVVIRKVKKSDEVSSRVVAAKSDPQADMQIGKHKTIGLHLHRPYADEQRTKETPALCGDESGGNYVVIAEGGDLLATRPQYPMAAYCLRCASLHTGKSIDELVGDWEQPLEVHG